MINYSYQMSLIETETAIFQIKQFFEKNLIENLNLHKVKAPIFVNKDSGIQDNLNGIEKPVSFKITPYKEKEYEIVQSLAKWKRYALKKYDIPEGEGILTDMIALRPDEPDIKTGIHSVFVDQWDWEKRICSSERNLSTLKDTVNKIYMSVKEVENFICERYMIKPVLPDKIKFIHTEELVKEYPDISSRERENLVCREYGAVFLIGIGGKLPDNKIHDGRAPDYDDWSTSTSDKTKGLNGDILFWNPVIERGFEISSMGIRVNKESLIKQLKIRDAESRLFYPWHKMLLKGELPESIGGGIGQSRLNMFLLRKKHIGEVQVSDWPEEIIINYEKRGVRFL
jgi:aspartate--ammonia ligase